MIRPAALNKEVYRFESAGYKDIVHVEKAVIWAFKVTFVTGESGSGKSTFIKMLNRFVVADRGTVFFKSRDIKDMDPFRLRRAAAMLPQAPVLFGETVRDNLIAGAIFSEKDLPDDERMKEALQIVKLDKGLNENSATLSGGEIQRISLARIILQDPEIFILDEPSSSLDGKTEKHVMENVVGYIKEKRKTAVIVSHSLKIAEKYSDEILMVNGRGVFRK